MPNNPYVNKVELADGTPLMDISSDTVSSASLMEGYTAHDASGAPIVGTASVPVTDVQLSGTSIVVNGVANIPPAGASRNGYARIDSAYGINANEYGRLYIQRADDSTVKAGTNLYRPIVPSNQGQSTFYGLAKAAGDTTQSASSNTVGNYTEDAKSKISDMLNAPVSVSGSAPTINAKAGIRYICGECATLSITAPASGRIDVLFKSGATPTVLTVSSAKSGVTAIKWANGFDATSLDASTTYEINILDGEFGVACSWT